MRNVGKKLLRSWISQLHKELFVMHFVLGEDLGNSALIDRHAGIHLAALHAALTDGLRRNRHEAEMIGRKSTVQGTPAWLTDRGLITGLRSQAEFERFADQGVRFPQ